MDIDGQRELFPDKINEKPPNYKSGDYVSRRQVRGSTKKPPYKILKLPKWIKEGRIRDTPSNI